RYDRGDGGGKKTNKLAIFIPLGILAALLITYLIILFANPDILPEFLRFGRGSKGENGYQTESQQQNTGGQNTPPAGNENEARGYLDQAEGFLEKGDARSANDILDTLESSGMITDSSSLYNDFLRIRRAAQLNESNLTVSYRDYPIIRFRFDCSRYGMIDGVVNSEYKETASDGKIEGTYAHVYEEGDYLVIEYETKEFLEDKHREVELGIDADRIPVNVQTSYDLKSRNASIYLVAYDGSNYPVMKAYYWIIDEETGEAVDDLSSDSFTLTEYVEGATEDRLISHVYQGTNIPDFEVDDAGFGESMKERIRDEMYVVEYWSKESMSINGKNFPPREIKLTLDGMNYTGTCDSEIEGPGKTDKKDDGDHEYEVVKGAYSWQEAYEMSRAKGGHLVTITSAEEEAKIIKMAEEAGLKYIWLGGWSEPDGSGFKCYWITGEEFTYKAFSENEPSGTDKDGTKEQYLMLWYVERLGGWCWNDQRNDPAKEVKKMGESMGFIIEYDDYSN
ncbi:MAG: hypothetical protein IJM62_01085, partial [Lachnospiraceae bacterium]|nr:hypothetical protein [Lachnospiraceae bacterium]